MQPCPNLGAYSIQFYQASDRAVVKQEYVAVVDVASISQKVQQVNSISWQNTMIKVA